ncbi:diguanylate cyclase [Methylomonas sp. AM2-LC]|uniref:diguanylate cyclase n=1 Tax=Methylomonas sp. AM2-LC TaxID=3153301 RepID=UPI00326768DA
MLQLVVAKLKGVTQKKLVDSIHLFISRCAFLVLQKVFRISWFLLAYHFIGFINTAYAVPLPQKQIVDLQLRWHHQFQFAGYYAALEKGYYAEEGLDVRLHPGDPLHQPVEAVLSGHAQYAEGNSEVLFRRLQGKPLIALAAIFQHSPSILLVRKDSKIDKVHKLIGKKIMLMHSDQDADFLTMFLNEGISLAQLNIMPSSYNIEDLISGKVDVFNAYITNEPYVLEERGIPYDIIDPNNYRIDFYSDILFTSEAELFNHPKRVDAIRRATLKGWSYAMAHPEEIIDLLINHYAVEKSRNHLQNEAAEMRKLILPDLIEIGHINPERFQRMADSFVQAGMVKHTQNLEGFVYDLAPKHLPRWVLVALVASLATIMLIATITSYLLKMNRRLAYAETELRSYNSILSTEIEERIAIENSLRNSEIRYRSLFENMLGGVAYCQMLYGDKQINDFIFLEVNPGFEPITGLKNVNGKTVTEVIPEIRQTNPELFEVLERVVISTFPEKFEIYLKSLTAWFSLSIYSTGNDFFMIIFDNITERQQLQKKYEHMAHVDFLTGLSNRGYFMELAEAELLRIQRYGGTVSLLMLDLDHFKKINDNYGHQIGDRVLQKVSEVCQSALRDVDVMGRLGGEEFVILLPETQGKEAIEVAERLRGLFANADISIDDKQILSFTTSIGVVWLTEQITELSALLHYADQALYQAKRSGRNKVLTFLDVNTNQPVNFDL